MVLNSAQTWHQVRPGEVRHDCGGCHAHSQQPTKFELTAAADPDYQTFDLTQKTPLLVGKDRDESGHKWDAEDSTGLRYADGPKTVEFHRDVKPIFERSCVACHTHTAKEPAGNLVLDDETPLTISKSNKNQPVFGGTAENVPGTYVRLAGDPNGEFGHDPLHRHGWRAQGLLASRYVRLMQSRRSLLIWKVFGRRLDGFKNDDFPHLAVAGDVSSLQFKGEKVPYDGDIKNPAYLPQIAYTGGIMPPPEAVAGTYVGPEGMKIKVEPLSDEDRRTLVRWIDLGCPIDLDYDSARPDESYGWPLDDQRPTLTLAQPIAGTNARLDRILVGMHDYNTGLDPKSLEVVADFAVDGQEAGTNLAGRFKPASTGVWELALEKPITELAGGTLTVTIKDRQGNTTSIERTFSVRSGGH
jgi:hypothetical protein